MCFSSSIFQIFVYFPSNNCVFCHTSGYFSSNIFASYLISPPIFLSSALHFKYLFLFSSILVNYNFKYIHSNGVFVLNLNVNNLACEWRCLTFFSDSTAFLSHQLCKVCQAKYEQPETRVKKVNASNECPRLFTFAMFIRYITNNSHIVYLISLIFFDLCGCLLAISHISLSCFECRNRKKKSAFNVAHTRLLPSGPVTNLHRNFPRPGKADVSSLSELNRTVSSRI